MSGKSDNERKRHRGLPRAKRPHAELDEAEFVKEAMDFAYSDYLHALALGKRMDKAEREGVFSSIPGLEFSVVDVPINGSEDFALVAERVPTAYLMLGVGVDGGVTNHNPRAVFYDDKLYLASAMLARSAVELLSGDRFEMVKLYRQRV